MGMVEQSLRQNRRNDVNIFEAKGTETGVDSGTRERVGKKYYT